MGARVSDMGVSEREDMKKWGKNKQKSVFKFVDSHILLKWSFHRTSSELNLSVFQSAKQTIGYTLFTAQGVTQDTTNHTGTNPKPHPAHQPYFYL